MNSSTMENDHKRDSQLTSQTDLNTTPEMVANQVLQICNVVRKRMNVHNNSFDYIRGRSGIGGTGGRNLSPELRVKFGSFGFSRRNGQRNTVNTTNGDLKQHLDVNLNDRMIAERGKTKKISLGGACVVVEDFEPEVGATMPSRPSGERINVIDSIETGSESLNKPPD